MPGATLLRAIGAQRSRAFESPVRRPSDPGIRAIARLRSVTAARGLLSRVRRRGESFNCAKASHGSRAAFRVGPSSFREKRAFSYSEVMENPGVGSRRGLRKLRDKSLVSRSATVSLHLRELMNSRRRVSGARCAPGSRREGADEIESAPPVPRDTPGGRKLNFFGENHFAAPGFHQSRWFFF